MPSQITSILNIPHPIIQAPMLGVVTPQMVAAANRADCLGSLPLGDANYNICIEKVRATKKETDQPFAVNIFVNDIPPITDALRKRYNRTKQCLSELSDQLGFETEFPEIDEIQPKGYKQQIPAILEEDIKILSFTFGNLDTESIQLLHENDVVLIGTCNSLEEALILENSNIDIICVQGIEAGGHMGTFQTKSIPKTPGLTLLQQIKAKVKIPLIYAGGIRDKDSILQLKKFGAVGFQVGTILLCSKESALHDFQKKRLTTVTGSEVILTNSFSGRYARGIKNKFTELFDNSDYILPYPYQNKLTKVFRDAAKISEQADWLSIWVGQSFQDLSFESTEAILGRLV